jgi:hypothetical protein
MYARNFSPKQPARSDRSSTSQFGGVREGWVCVFERNVRSARSSERAPDTRCHPKSSHSRAGLQGDQSVRRRGPQVAFDHQIQRLPCLRLMPQGAAAPGLKAKRRAAAQASLGCSAHAMSSIAWTLAACSITGAAALAYVARRRSAARAAGRSARSAPGEEDVGQSPAVSWLALAAPGLPRVRAGREAARLSPTAALATVGVGRADSERRSVTRRARAAKEAARAGAPRDAFGGRQRPCTATVQTVSARRVCHAR